MLGKLWYGDSIPVAEIARVYGILWVFWFTRAPILDHYRDRLLLVTSPWPLLLLSHLFYSPFHGRSTTLHQFARP